MQIHLSRRLLTAWRTLPPEARRFIEGLRRNPRPADAMTITGRPNYYEEFVGDYWIGWSVDDSGNETIIRVTISE